MTTEQTTAEIDERETIAPESPESPEAPEAPETPEAPAPEAPAPEAPTATATADATASLDLAKRLKAVVAELESGVTEPGDLLTPSEKLRAIADLIDRRESTAAPLSGG
jgi:hypothetical protein